MPERFERLLLTGANAALVRAALRARTLPERIRRIEFAASFAKFSGCGGLVSPQLERALLAEAAACGSCERVPVEADTVLMVMSEALFFGGHTRVVERWIETDGRRRYSLAVTRQRENEVPARLAAAVRKSGGAVFSVSEGEIVERARRLRQLSARFGAVVLFAHWDDTLPLLAYGRDDFPRPVGLFNHADHAFWLGLSIADAIGELRTWGLRLSENCRGSSVSRVLTIPGDAVPRRTPDRASARAARGFSPAARLVVTAGAAYKFNPVAGVGFAEVIRRLLGEDPTVELAVIGAGPDEFPEGRRLVDRFGGRLHLLPRMAHAQMLEWFAAADVVLGSLPVPGFTVVADALACGRPVLMCETPGGLMDWMTSSPALCASVPELVRRTRILLDDPAEAARVWRTTWDRLQEADSPQAFRLRLETFFGDLARAGHCLHGFGAARPLPEPFARFLMRTGVAWLDAATESRCFGLFGKWALPNVLLRCRRHPLRTPGLLLRWIGHGCR